MLLSWLETFVETAMRGSVSEASQTLHVTQPAVSTHLKLLQAELGVKLYTRNSRGIALTMAGKLFFKDVDVICRQINDLKKGRHFDENRYAALNLKLGGSYSSTPLLTRLVAQYKKKHLEVNISLRTGNNHDLSQMVIAGDVEIGVVKAAPSSAQLTIEKYRREQLVIFAPPTHALTHKSVVRADAVAKYPLVIRYSGELLSTAQALLHQLQIGGLHFRVALHCQTPATVMEAVRNKIGLGLLYRSTIAAEIKRGNFVMIRCPEIKLEGNSFIIYRRDCPLSQQASEFLDLLRRHKRH